MPASSEWSGKSSLAAWATQPSERATRRKREVLLGYDAEVLQAIHPKMKCPKDSSELKPVQYFKQTMKCETCLGALVHSEDLVTRITNHGMDLSKLHPHRKFEITCPGCSRTMDSWVISSAELDVCKECNRIWFDPGEIQKVNQPAYRPANSTGMKSGASMDDFGFLQALSGFGGIW